MRALLVLGVVAIVAHTVSAVGKGVGNSTHQFTIDDADLHHFF